MRRLENGHLRASLCLLQGLEMAGMKGEAPRSRCPWSRGQEAGEGRRGEGRGADKRPSRTHTKSPVVRGVARDWGWGCGCDAGFEE